VLGLKLGHQNLLADHPLNQSFFLVSLTSVPLALMQSWKKEIACGIWPHKPSACSLMQILRLHAMTAVRLRRMATEPHLILERLPTSLSCRLRTLMAGLSEVQVHPSQLRILSLPPLLECVLGLHYLTLLPPRQASPLFHPIHRRFLLFHPSGSVRDYTPSITHIPRCGYSHCPKIGNIDIL
jgi:hypothetical protein